MSKTSIISFCEKVIEGCFYALLIAVTFSTSLVEIAASIMIAAWVVKKLAEVDMKWAGPVPIKLLLVFLAWSILSCVGTDYPKESFRGVFKVLEYALLFIIVSTEMRKEETIKRTLGVMITVTVIICLNGLYQHFAGVDLIRQRYLIDNDYLRRISSSFVHPNSFGAYLMVVCTIWLSFVTSRASNLKNRIRMLGVFVLSVTCLELTRSRGSWLSFMAGACLLGSIKWKKFAVILIVLVLAALIVATFFIIEHMDDIKDLKGGTIWERLMLWKGTVNMIKASPVTGLGINTYSKNFPEYKPKDYPDIRYSHNCYLQMASEIGIPGALIFIFFIISTLGYSLAGIFRMDKGLRKNFAMGLVAALTGFSLGGIVDTHLYSLNLAVFFYSLLGYCYAITRYEKSR